MVSSYVTLGYANTLGFFGALCSLALKTIYKTTENVIYIKNNRSFVMLHMFQGLPSLQSTQHLWEPIFPSILPQSTNFTGSLKARFLSLKILLFSQKTFWTEIAETVQSNVPGRVFLFHVKFLFFSKILFCKTLPTRKFQPALVKTFVQSRW